MNEKNETESHINRIYDGIGNASELIDAHNLDDQPGAPEKLGPIADLADALAAALESLCVKPCGSHAEPEASGNGVGHAPQSEKPGLAAVELAAANLESLQDVMAAALYQLCDSGSEGLGCLHVVEREIKRIRQGLDSAAP